MRPPLPAQGQGVARRSRLGDGHRIALKHRHAVVAVLQGAGLCTAHGRGATPCPHLRRQYGLSPALSRKGSVLHYKLTPVKSIVCVLHMCVAQSPACHALTDRRPQRADELRDACRERARDKYAGIIRTVTRRGCRTPLTRCAMQPPSYRSATSLRLASVSPSM